MQNFKCHFHQSSLLKIVLMRKWTLTKLPKSNTKSHAKEDYFILNCLCNKDSLITLGTLLQFFTHLWWILTSDLLHMLIREKKIVNRQLIEKIIEF